MEPVFRTHTRVGVPRVQAGSRSENDVTVFAIVSEGQEEEPQYLRYVIGMCRRKAQTTMSIHIVNDELGAISQPIHGSNPTTRLLSLKTWLDRYNPDFKYHPRDTAWLVCDRDDGSFSIRQFCSVVKECSAMRIHFILSNPAFQLWLLFHYTDNIQLKVLNQAKYSKGKLKQVERMLIGFVPDYTHGEIDMTNFELLLDAAIHNSQQYPTMVSTLKRNIGSNFYELMEHIKQAFGIRSFAEVM